jgi:putative ABC transport system substrate-binding protein
MTRRGGTRGLAGLLVAIVALSVGCSGSPSTPPTQKVWRIGLFHVGLDHVPASLDGLKNGLRALGYEQGKNIEFDWRNLPDEEAARATALEFARSHVDLIVAFENQTARAAKAATSEVPVVFLHVIDPVADGLVESLSHPGGNLTGLVGYGDLAAKQLETFKDVDPSLKRVMVLADPLDPVSPRLLGEVETAAAALKVEPVEREVSTKADIERVFGSPEAGRVDGVFVASQNLQTKFSSLMVHLALERHLPFLSHWSRWAKEGALVSFGPDFKAVGEAGARYVDEIIRGAKPAQLPVEQMSWLQFAINLKTARTLGLSVPAPMLELADVVYR